MSDKYQSAGKTSNQAKNDKEIVVAEPSDANYTPDGEGASIEQLEAEMQAATDGDWLALARDAYTISEDYFDASIRKSVERNIAHFNLQHQPGSKYYSDLYKYRAKGFRPKTRAVIRQNEAKAAVALFATSDVAHVVAENDADPQMQFNAEINEKLLQYRLKNTVDWFQTSLGAFQDSLTTGVCISYQCWDYEEVVGEMEEEQQEGMLSEPSMQQVRTIIRDTPSITLRPIENVRFSPAADWRDPIGTSPYVIDVISMQVADAKQMVKQGGKTNIPWREDLPDSIWNRGNTEAYDSIRQMREKNRQDSKDQSHMTKDFDVVWIHRNIIKRDGIDYIFYTLGTHELLSDPIPLVEEYGFLKMGERPYIMGKAMIEAHKTYPESIAGLGSSLQNEANDINNQRRDNVQLVLNRRYYARRGAQIDYRSLIKNIPGSVTEMDNIDTDIRSEAPPEVTGSSYQEQDRINMDFDELMGSFSTSSVGSNRQLNETVGGMEMLSGNANDVTEYQLRTFVQTWVEPVLKQVIRMEQYYETDEALLSLMGDKIKAWKRYQVDRITDRMLQGDMLVEINVGFGATNPKQKIDKLAMGLNYVLQMPGMSQRLNSDEVGKEVFGAIGYDTHERFFPQLTEEQKQAAQQPQDPKVLVEQMRAQAKMQELQAQHQMDMKRMEVEAAMKLKSLQQQQNMSSADHQVKLALAEMDKEKEMMNLAARQEMSLQSIKAQLAQKAMQERGTNERFVAEKEFAERQPDGGGFSSKT